MTPIQAPRAQRVFYLGGHDLEMETIRELLEQEVPGQYHDRGLSWGAKASDYRPEIEEALRAGRTTVLVELEPDIELPQDRLVLVDHHGSRAGRDKPTSLHQVFGLLGLPPQRWTRRHDLVAANDRGHIREMLALRPPATREEIEQIRSADRAAQGVTPEQEAAAEAAVAHAEHHAGGRLTVVRLPHARVSAAADRMEPVLGGPGYENLLVFCPDETAFFGQGPLVLKLAERFPNGWYGGALPERGFWGHAQSIPDLLTEICAWIAECPRSP